ncbi:CYTH domain-containing protein [Bacillus inaquosorum]|uniref:CYTH domain-containing protein n=1 Tax=Bacillus inaquosorum TaxID=483913 RepID=UPI003D03F124
MEEKELKISLSEKEYNLLVKTKSNDTKEVRQVNHYFDTKNLTFKKNNITLRMRSETNSIKLTLKIKSKVQNQIVHSEEYNYDLTKKQYRQILECPILIFNILGSQASQCIFSLGIKAGDIMYLDKIKNLRISYEIKGNIVFQIDKTYFPNNKVEYELEVEDLSSVEGVLMLLKKDFGIIAKNHNPASKYSRFIKYLNTDTV